MGKVCGFTNTVKYRFGAFNLFLTPNWQDQTRQLRIDYLVEEPPLQKRPQATFRVIFYFWFLLLFYHKLNLL